MYVNNAILYNRLGEACSHFAAIFSCVFNAAETYQRSGTDSCISKQCSWLPTAQEVLYWLKLSLCKLHNYATGSSSSNTVFIRPAKCNSTQDGQCSSDSADVCTPKKNITSNRWSPWWLFEGWINAVNKPMLFKILQPYHKELILKLREFPMPTSEYNLAT